MDKTLRAIAGPSADATQTYGSLTAGSISPSPVATEAWRDLAILGAVMAVWPDLSVDVRLRIMDGAFASAGRTPPIACRNDSCGPPAEA